MMNNDKNDKRGVRQILLMGVFWRILIIEIILLIWSLAYRVFSENPTTSDLLYYAVRIVILIAIILLFMMVTLRSFLTKKIILPLEAIAAANRRLRENDQSAKVAELPNDAPREIKGIVSSQSKMLKTILKVSEERLNLVNFIRETFGRYLSKKVVDEILESPEGGKVGGRRENVTILMSDLRGFTSISETRDPEEMVKLLNRYLERMSNVILKYDGMIDEFIGDAILVVFGVPEKRDDDEARAVACAIDMQNALTDLNQEMVKDRYPHLEMGIGINTGSVIVGNIGSELRMKYGIVGSTVNTASRIESNATGGQILLGETTYNLVKDLVTAETPNAVMMKGLKTPLVIYPVSAIGEPYNVRLKSSKKSEGGIEIKLPFHCWKVEEKKVSSKSMWGETTMLSEDSISASIKAPLNQLDNIKLIFNFCLDAHCFDDIYAKILSVDEKDKEKRIHMSITSINQKDREVLTKWIHEAS